MPQDLPVRDVPMDIHAGGYQPRLTPTPTPPVGQVVVTLAEAAVVRLTNHLRLIGGGLDSKTELYREAAMMGVRDRVRIAAGACCPKVVEAVDQMGRSVGVVTL